MRAEMIMATTMEMIMVTTMEMIMVTIMEMTKKMIMEMVIEEKRGLCELFLVAFFGCLAFQSSSPHKSPPECCLIRCRATLGPSVGQPVTHGHGRSDHSEWEGATIGDIMKRGDNHHTVIENEAS